MHTLELVGVGIVFTMNIVLILEKIFGMPKTQVKNWIEMNINLNYFFSKIESANIMIYNDKIYLNT